MSAQSLQVLTLVFAEPQNRQTQTKFQRVNGSISYNYLTTFDIRTLSTNSASPGADVTGLIYTPDLPEGDSCIEASQPWVPANVTRQADLPPVNFDLVAVAPWISPQCTLAYMKSAWDDPVRGFLFFLPDNSTDQPAPPNDPKWGLGDGGRWKQDNSFPVYVLPGMAGQMLLEQSALYSGNMSTVPFAENLTELYDDSDYVRLFADIDTGSTSALPSLWVFLLVVLAILLAVIGLTSVLMHWLQRRRRSQLRARVVSGEVDLEALGIKRLTVPQDMLDTLPLYVYGTRAPSPPPPTHNPKSSTSTTSRPTSPLPSTTQQPALHRTSSYHPTAFQQPTCAICLDDFLAPNPSASPPEPGTQVRELPCHHIFHPDCVDTFLRSNSSLCPMCKKTVLPKGYCPKNVTNAMVRRERLLRRVRNGPNIPSGAGGRRRYVGRDVDVLEDADAEPQTLGQRLQRRAFSPFVGRGARVSSAPTHPSSTSQDGQQMANLSSRRSVTTTIPSTPADGTTATGSERPSQAPGSAGRREWARQRAVAMLGTRRAPIDPEAEEAERRPRWRKVLGGVFPGLVR